MSLPTVPLCAVDEIPDGGTRAFGPSPGGFTGLFAVRKGEEVFVYLNACPHIGVPLDWAPGRFLSSDASRIVCSMHGAEFAIENGLCTSGPCLGDRLEVVMIEIRDGIIHVAGDAGL